MLRLLERGLEDISVSRTGQRWGIPLPFDPSSVVYVWFDALINYIAAVGYGSDEERFAEWWPVGPARCGEGHHPVPRCCVASDAHECRSGVTAQSVWPRLDQLAGPAYE